MDKIQENIEILFLIFVYIAPLQSSELRYFMIFKLLRFAT